jgi:isopenicillin-N epimerase
MLTRREWVGAALAFSAWPTLRATGPASAPAPPDGEAYWAAIRARFELVPEPANLVTVVRGVSSSATRQIAAAEAERLNAFRPALVANPNWKQEVRAKAAAFIGASADEVALLRNTTEGVTTVLSNWPLQRGDEILTSSAEHGPFYDTLASRSSRDGVTIRRFHYPAPATSTSAIVDAVERAMTPRTRLVMLGHVVLFGQIVPVREIADRVHARGAKLLVDGVLAIGHIPTDVKAMACDFYAAGFHKFACGPRATAVFYVRPNLAQRLPPLFGRLEEDEQGRAVVQWNTSAMTKFETFGAHPESQFFALGDALDFLSGIGVDRIQQRLFSLTSHWMSRAERVPAFRVAVMREPTHCAGLVGFEISGIDQSRMRQVLTEHRVLVGRTESYAGFFGIPDGSPRSLFCPNVGIFTSRADVDRLADAIEDAAERT